MVKAIYTRLHMDRRRHRLEQLLESAALSQPSKFQLSFALAVFALLCAISSYQHAGIGNKLPMIRTKSSIQEERACQRIPESTDLYIQEVHQYIENPSLASWTSKDGQWSFPHLDTKLLQSAFGKKRVAFVGDSTTLYMFQNLNTLLNITHDPNFLGRIADSRTTLPDAIMAIARDAMDHGSVQGFLDLPLDSPNEAEAILRYPQANNAETMWTGFHGPNYAKNCQFDQLVWPDLLDFQPDVIVANWGLHMFHTGPGAYPKPLCNVHQFLHYEEWLETVVQVAQEAGTKLLLFKTTNKICEGKLPPLMRQSLASYWSNKQDFVERCAANLQEAQKNPSATAIPEMNDGFHFSNAELKIYCGEAANVDESAQRLNERMRKFVATKQEEPGLPRIEIFNDHDLERCEYLMEGDGVHHLMLQVPRIRLLAHMLDCLVG